MCDGGDDITARAVDLATVESAVARFRARRRKGCPPEVLRDRMLRLRHLIDVLEVEFARDTAALSSCDELEWQGHVSPIQWVKHECRTTTTAAVNAWQVGVQAALLPESNHALLAGQIGFGHLALLAQTAGAITAPGSAASFEEGVLLAKAKAHSVGKFRHDCEHARHAADQRRFLADQVDQVEARFLELETSAGGALFLRGFLDCEGGATLRTALEPLAARSGDEDLRHRDRRLADALVELAGHVLDTGVPSHTTGQRPHLQVTATLDTLQGRDGSPAGELEWGGPIAAETVRRLGCDASVARVVFDSDSAVLDVGRARRVPAAATRRALKARDGGCVWPGCDRPASWSQAHHLTHWARGGSTDLDNLVTICRAHHWKVHEGGWRLIRTDEGMVVLPPVPLELRSPRTLTPEDLPASETDPQWRWLPGAPQSSGDGAGTEGGSRPPVAAVPAQARAPDPPSTA
ncbi:MAG: DUF222 domain-containing protein [Candidatus Dormibacteria bacterium]|jgi:hypothetical protein